MNRNLRRAAAAAATILLGSFGATASQAACVVGPSSGGEPSLQAALNQMLAPAPDVGSACLDDGHDSYWTSTGRSSATVLLELAGFANVNSFGLFDSADPDNRLEVFVGSADAGARAQLTFGANGWVTVSYGAHVIRRAKFSGEAFGFYLLTGEGNRLMSDSALNPGGVDRMYAYTGTGAEFVGGPVARDGNSNNNIFNADDVILAYEDLLSGDNDFQDFVVLVRGVSPIPLPAGAWLFLSAGAGWWLRRRRAMPAGRAT